MFLRKEYLVQMFAGLSGLRGHQHWVGTGCERRGELGGNQKVSWQAPMVNHRCHLAGTWSEVTCILGMHLPNPSGQEAGACELPHPPQPCVVRCTIYFLVGVG